MKHHSHSLKEPTSSEEYLRTGWIYSMNCINYGQVDNWQLSFPSVLVDSEPGGSLTVCPWFYLHPGLEICQGFKFWAADTPHCALRAGVTVLVQFENVPTDTDERFAARGGSKSHRHFHSWEKIWTAVCNALNLFTQTLRIISAENVSMQYWK